jgi:hypothetical protein
VRERGVQSRRARATEAGASRRLPPPPRSPGFWPVLAIVALLAATAGWTTVAVLVLREPTAAAEPTDDLTGDASEPPGASLEPVADSHVLPALEALLPLEVNGIPLTAESWTGDTLILDDAWSAKLQAFLTSVDKVPADIGFAQAYDPSEAGGLDLSVGVWDLPGVDPVALRDAIIDAWKGDYAELTLSELTLGGVQVTKGDFGAGQLNSYWYVHDGRVFDIGTADESLAAAALAGLREPGASGSPGSSGSPRPSGSPVPAPSPSPG